MAKGGDGATTTTASRRKRGDGDHDGPKRPLIERRQILTGAVALALIILVFMVTQKDGGAPQANTFSSQSRATVEAWRFVAEPASGADVVLCSDDTEPCDPEVLWQHHLDNATCTLTTGLWLAGTDLPIVLRDVRGTVNVTAWTGDYTARNNTTLPVNITTTPIEQPLRWDNGLWWRVESERIQVTVEAPCDTHRASIIIRLRGAAIDGDAWSDNQSANVDIHQEYLATLGRAPSAAPIS